MFVAVVDLNCILTVASYVIVPACKTIFARKDAFALPLFIVEKKYKKIQSVLLVGSACLLGLAVLGCRSAQTPLIGLDDALDSFGRRLRWNDFMAACAYMSKQAAKAAQASGQIEDIRVTSVTFGQPVRNQDDSVRVGLAIDWYRLSQGRLLHTVVEQKWRKKDSSWLIVEQRWMRGPPLPLLPVNSEK